MSITLSKYFKIPAAELRKRGVLNAHLGKKQLAKGHKVPEVVVIDARKKRPASKR